MENNDLANTNNTNGNRKILLLSMSSFFLIVGFIWLFYWLVWGRYEETTDDAYVNGNVVQLTSQINGTVAAIYGDDTALINQGLPIIQLDNTDYRLQLDQAEAELARTIRTVEQLFANDLQLQTEYESRTTEFF